MNLHRNKRRSAFIFVATFLITALIFLLSVVKTHVFNSRRHTAFFSEKKLFTVQNDPECKVCVGADVRDSVWTKAIDVNDEGIVDHNYQAYTVDFYVSNNTKDQVKDFSLKLNFYDDTLLLSAWNGSIETHQKTEGGEIVDEIEDLREFDPVGHVADTITSDGDIMIYMKPGDYLNYTPSASSNAMEIPIEPNEETVPGIILYFPIGDSLDETMSVELDYSFHRFYTSEPLFWIAVVLLGVWIIALVIYVITSIQIKKYQDRHERDNKIINESMETFIGFIDAKDPYTNGHSIRVAKYTRLLAEELGYKGEELERIYYVALLHDCGKIGVPDKILGKPGRLTDEEFEIIKSHTVRGGEIMSHFKSIEAAGEGALYHHERYDGNGYPEGKKGEEIPFIARIICVADAFDAMNTNRVYRDKLTKEDIIAEIERCKGKQFDPKVADVMVSLLKNDKLNIDDAE